jgi:hypothetical protein
MKILLTIMFSVILAARGHSQSELSVVNHKPYAELFVHGPFRPYTFRICAIVPAGCSSSEILRSANDIYPGDYFWPPFTVPRGSSIDQPSAKEKQQIAQFLKEYFPEQFQNPALIDSAWAYNYGCYENVDRREFYVMLSQGDTIFVISGWMGKFISFFRVVPHDRKATPSGFIKQVKDLAPALGKLGLSDSLAKVYNYAGVVDSNYFMETYDKDSRLWLRHYPFKAVLPPDNPEKGKERLYNLIEISKIYDQDMLDARVSQLLHPR